jgi:hypothetical protein
MSRILSHWRAWTCAFVGLAVMLAWWIGASTPEDALLPSATSPGPVVSARLESTDAIPLPTPFQRQASAGFPLTQPAPWLAESTGQDRRALVPITVTSPPTLHVGEQTELLVGVGANADVSEVSFTVRFDPDVLQVRAAAEGDWLSAGARPATSFAAQISETGDRVQVRSVAASKRASTAGGSVAVVQFQAVAPGTTWVVIADVTVKDLAGDSLPVLLSSPKLQVTAESLTPAPSVAHGSRAGVPMDAPATEAVVGD